MANEHLKYYIEAIWKGKRATVEAKKDIEGVGTAGEKGSKGTLAFSSALTGLVAGGALVAAAGQAFEFGKASVNAFSDAEEAYGKFNVVFGDFADRTEKDLDAIAEATGRSKYELIDYASTIQDTFVPLGFARGEAAKLATSITELAIDLASFNNLETADVVRDLQSALVGNTETLRKYGVVAQETQIKQEAITLGLWDGVGAIDAETKARAILSLAYKGTTDAQGDAIRTADSLANKQRALEASTLDLKVAVGEGLVPALAEGASGLIPIINTTTDYINNNRMLKKALDEGIISQELYNKTAFSLGTGWEMESELLAEVNKKIREHDQGMTDAEASAVRYYQGMGEVAVTLEAAKAETEELNPAIKRLKEEYERATQGTEEFREKTGQSAEELMAIEEAAQEAASTFNTTFSSALGNTGDAFYTNSVNAGMLNEQLFSQVAGMSDNAIVTASAAIALGQYDETQVATALNAAIMQEEIRKLAEEFVNGDITAGQMRERMDEIVAGSPYTAEVEALVDQAISNIDKVKSKLDAIDGMVAKASVQVTSSGVPSGSATSGGGGGGRGDVPGFAGGGMVPGPIGSPQLILAHGGEQVLTPGQQRERGGGGGVVQNFYSNTREAQALAWAQAEQMRRNRMDNQ